MARWTSSVAATSTDSAIVCWFHHYVQESILTLMFSKWKKKLYSKTRLHFLVGVFAPHLLIKWKILHGPWPVLGYAYAPEEPVEGNDCSSSTRFKHSVNSGAEVHKPQYIRALVIQLCLLWSVTHLCIFTAILYTCANTVMVLLKVNGLTNCN